MTSSFALLWLGAGAWLSSSHGRRPHAAGRRSRRALQAAALVLLGFSVGAAIAGEGLAVGLLWLALAAMTVWSALVVVRPLFPRTFQLSVVSAAVVSVVSWLWS